MNQPKEKEKFRCILVFGPPGVGKGTMGKFLSQASNHYHLSSGDIFRGLDPQSEIGKTFYHYANQGLLVPDEVTVDIWQQFVSGLIATNCYFPNKQFLLLDGFPRTATQAKLIEQYVSVEHVLNLHVPDKQILFDRLQNRAKIEGRLDDLNIEVLNKRMEVYNKETKEILEIFPKEKITSINANQKPLEVLRDILINFASIL